LQKQATHIEHHFDVLRRFDETKTRLCQDLLAGRRDIESTLAGMRQCLEQYGPSLLSHHRANLPNSRQQGLVLAYLYHKVSSLAGPRPESREQLRRIRQGILERYPNTHLVEFGSGQALPWVAAAE